MSASNEVIAGKVVPISDAELAKAVQTPLSGKVQEIIVSSGVQSLQILTETQSAMAEAVMKQYWNKK